MATKDDLDKTEKSLVSAKKVRDDLKKSLQNPSLTPSARRAILTKIKTAESDVTRLEKAVKPLRDANRKAEEAAKKAIESGRLSQDKFETGLTQRKNALQSAQKEYFRKPEDDDKYADYQKKLKELYDYEQQGVAQSLTVTPTIQQSQDGYAPITASTPAVGPVTAPTGPVPGGRFVAPVQRGVTPGQVATTPPTTATTTTTDTTPPPSGTTTPPTGTTTSPTTTDKGKKGGKKQPTPTGTGPLGLTAKVRADLIKQFPQFSSSFDGGEGEQAFIDFFGQDAADLIVKAGTTDAYEYLSTEAGLAAYRRDFENTAYGQRTNQAQQDFDVNPKNQAVLIKAKQDEITKSYADLQLTQTQLQEVARDAARNAYTGDALRFAVYNYAYKGNQVTATESALADQIRNAGKAYGYTVSEDKLKAALTGTPYLGRMVTQESLLQEAQAAAKGSYSHLADQIDSGLTLEDIFYNYRMFASRTLGIDPNEIDFMKDTKWADAFGTKDSGQLTLNDWTRKLKTDEKYGWQFTDEANQTATKLVADMEKAFGFRK